MIADGLIDGSMADFLDDHVQRTDRGVLITLSDGNHILVQGTDLSVQDVADDIFLF